MDKLRKMAFFTRVVELGSFAATAQDMGVSPAIVGRHIADLEAMLELRLINRTTRSMEVTEAGQRYYDGCKAALEQIAAMEQDISHDPSSGPEGTIRFAAPEGLGSPFLLDLIESFQARFPKIRVELLLENRETDFVSSGADLAIRLATSLEDSSLIVRKLAETRLSLYAAPKYLETRGTPHLLSELADHACLNFGASRFGNAWPLMTEQGIRKLRQPWQLSVNQTQVYRDAIVRGMGIGLLPDIMAVPLVESGALMQLATDAQFPKLGIYALYPARNFQPQRVRIFLEHLRNAFAPRSVGFPS